jgi:hypothetical protein
MNTPTWLTAVRAGLMVALALSFCGCGEEDSVANIAPIGLAPPPTLPPPIPPPPPFIPPCSVIPPLPAECSTFEFEAFSPAGPIADAVADVLVQPDKGWGPQTGYWSLYGEFRSDQAGHFVSKALPPATLTVRAFGNGIYLQPCAAVIRTPSSGVTRIEVFPREAFDTTEALRPLNATEPSFVGTVYEMTPAGRKPVSGAELMVGYDDADLYWWFDGPSIAATRSSLEGHYYFCNLPPNIQIFVEKAGFMNTVVLPGAVSTGVPLDIELRRTGS